jgi:hypothetical protein
MKKNNILLTISGGAIGIVVIYVISSYSGLLATKTYKGDEATELVGDVAVATSLDCTWNADNTLQATLTVKDSAENSVALETGSPLEAQTIQWSVAESLGKIVPPITVTDSDGVALSHFEKTPDAEIPVIIAAFEETPVEIEIGGRKTTVRYGTSWCELSPSI